MAFLELAGLERRYGDYLAVAALDLTVEKGEFVSLLGPSGCGKTTTLQMIAGFVEPTAGRVVIDGTDMAPVPANRRGIGIVFQSYALFPHMTVTQNVAFGLEMRKVPAAERQRRVAEALELVHLGHLGSRYPRQLSGGQQQRVALARALVIEPRLLLLDEPMSNLDAKLREDMQLELRRLQRKLGITTIMVTHDQNEAMGLSDRIAVMRSGRIVQVDTPERAYERPADGFASTFLGKSNLFQAEAVAADRILLPGGRAVEAPAGELDGRSGAVLCSLRPEKLRLVPAGTGRLDGTIASRIFLGNHWLFQATCDLGTILVYRQNEGGSAPEEGATVGLDWPTNALRLLDPEEEAAP
ncbi:ABC transporter ATP-binding protein [Aliidongia dinghuensis]|uniref:ABC transporter ATP-binding protein n=1 Tax=Aliidongia dinghuensis TaxID=1867774 RepID=A0A8J2YQD4_9PROT|nr:ABC transporter ATP-binding protein [Aliidongia dinghuensis]GGF04544.1 ABC transporter ATP-binding protein [Aliidongia dinghuensis]